MKRIVLFLVAGGAWLALSSTQAQEGALSELYGRGVHAYYAGRNFDAERILSTAIDAGSRDPRCFYFRGLNYLRLGRDHEAQADFTSGAGLEYGDSAGLYYVDKALERVQGYNRLRLERYRAAARTTGAARQLSERQQRVLNVDAAQPEVLSIPPGPPRVRPPAPGRQTPAPPPVNPFGEAPGDAPAAPPAAPPQARNLPAAGGDPFTESDPFNERPVVAARPRANPPPVAPANELPEPAPAQPANTAPAATANTEARPGAAKALGSIFRKALGGLVPAMPKVELPLGGNDQPPANPGNQPANRENDNPFGN